jgi:hypothetical protein
MARNNKRSKTQKGKTTRGRKAKPTTPVQEAAPVVETPVVETPVQEAATTTTKRTRKPRVVKKTVTDTEQAMTEVNTEVAPTETETPTTARRRRTFKVMLPNSETFEGRFIGISPYQAANKALSKYYKETKKPAKQIRFQLRESTRGRTRRNVVHTYDGSRQKLKTPIEYTIKSTDGEEKVITKNYKNHLVKVKKAELAATETATAAQ